MGQTYYQNKPQNPRGVAKQVIPSDDLESKMRRWLLIGLTALVSGIAVLLILISVIKKIF